jgi:hypothetical protein
MMMRNLITIGLVAILLPSAASSLDKAPGVLNKGAKPQSEAQTAIDEVVKNLSNILVELSALDKSDKKLALTNQTQIDTTGMLNRLEGKIKNEDIPAISERAGIFEARLQALANSGCVFDGSMVAAAIADRCNGENEELGRIREKIVADSEVVKTQLASIQTTRQAVTDTTLANTASQKINNARRDELNARRKIQEGMLSGIQASVNSCQALLVKKSATCEQIKSQCGMIQFDGAIPDLPELKQSPTPCAKKSI